MSIHLPLLGAGGPAAGAAGLAVSIEDAVLDNSNLTTYTFSSRALGAADAGRKIVIAVSWFNASTARAISSVTVGGVSATLLLESQVGSSAKGTELWIADVPLGTTGDIVVTADGNCANCAIFVVRTTGVSSSTPTATSTDVTTSITTTLSLNTLDNSIVIAAGFISGAGADTFNWSGVTKGPADLQTESATSSCAVALVATGQTPRTVTATHTGTQEKNGAAIVLQ